MSRKFAENELVIATHNQGKLDEFSALFAAAPMPRPRRGGGMGSGPQAPQMHLRPANMPPAAAGSSSQMARTWGERIRLLYSADFALPAPHETGTTFLENATIKALHTAQATERVALADDSGLAVAALNGAPGVYSADWAQAGKSRDYQAAMMRIVREIGHNPDRSAAFVCCMVLAWPDGHTESVEARVKGQIVWPPRGEEGFGYDPLFMPEGYDRTYAELDDATKNSISHRSAAFRMMLAKCFSW
jgi:XTP/dITP diphosphohydrolase